MTLENLIDFALFVFILWCLTDGIIIVERKYGQKIRRFFRTNKRG